MRVIAVLKNNKILIAFTVCIYNLKINIYDIKTKFNIAFYEIISWYLTYLYGNSIEISVPDWHLVGIILYVIYLRNKKYF